MAEHRGTWRNMAKNGGKWRNMVEHRGTWRNMAEHGRKVVIVAVVVVVDVGVLGFTWVHLGSFGSLVFTLVYFGYLE